MNTITLPSRERLRNLPAVVERFVGVIRETDSPEAAD